MFPPMLGNLYGAQAEIKQYVKSISEHKSATDC
jgi:hypothetical protein